MTINAHKLISGLDQRITVINKNIMLTKKRKEQPSRDVERVKLIGQIPGDIKPRHEDSGASEAVLLELQFLYSFSFLFS
jgi:hypothetical protein